MDFSRFDNHFREVDSEIENLLSGEPEKLYTAARHITFAGGKRIRPLLCMLSCEALNCEGNNAIKTAVAVELIHTFTLVHDDIMDRDKVRRGVPSVHEKFGETTAILAGDLLFSKVFEVSDTRAVGILAHAAAQICEGQEMDMEFEEREDVSESEYLKMIKKKTAVLLEAATKAGAILGNGDEEQVSALAKFGLSLGMAFQIHDDILGVTADEEKLGKPVGSDIVEGKKNLVMIKAKELLQGDEGDEFTRILGNGKESEVQRAIELIKNSGALEYCMEKEKGFRDDATNSLKDLPDTEAKKSLLELADFVIRRDS